MRSRRARSAQSHKVDLTPLLDTVFLLIVMLLCSFLHMRFVQAVEVERPVVTGGLSEGMKARELLEVTVLEDGRVFFEGAEVPLDQIIGVLAGRAANADSCLISADARARHGRVTNVLVAVKEAVGDKPTFFEATSENGKIPSGEVP